MVLLILGAVWAAVLIPPALRARAAASPGDSIGQFHHQLNVLRRTGGYPPRPIMGEFGPIAVPRMRVPLHPHEARASFARKRRRDVLVTLLWIMGASLALGLLPAFRALLLLHLVADALFLAYIALLVRMRKGREGRARQVARLPSRVAPGVSHLALRRAANT